MPRETTVKRARKAAREGKKPTTQAGEFVREEMEKLERGTGNARSRKQAVAIGLSEARRSGVNLGAPKRGKAPSATRKKAKKDLAAGRKKSGARTKARRR